VFYSHDGNKNVTDLVSSNGDVVAHYEFDPFGNIVVKTGVLADANPFRFSNEYFDQETGFVAYQQRYLKTETSAWLSRDLIEEQGGINLYGFVKNDSVDGADYLGLSRGPPAMPVDFINELPSIASAKGWGHLASLFNFWLSRPPFVITDAVNVKEGDPYNDTIVSMDWILSFGRASQRYNALLDESVYHSANAKARMTKRLTQDGLFGDNWFSASTAPTIRHQYWIVQESVGGAGVSPDALDAALHKFTLQSLVKGCKFGNSVRIDEIGVYAKDSFDFSTETQNLGYWAKPNIVRFPINYGRNNPEGYQVSNASFRQYREEKNRGGDFFIFSDIKTTVLKKPYVIKLR
jgi:RHS repeat-associated protein